MLFVRSLAAIAFAGASLAVSVPKPLAARQEPTPTAGAADPASTVCGEIIKAVDGEGANLFYASDAIACLTSVPFNAAVATRFLRYWNETIQLHSTLAYLKNPTEGYQQPAIDVNAALAGIQQNINGGVYKNQYAFEADFQTLVQSMHDQHVDISAGIMSAFTFASPYSLVSLSKDGKETPKIYLLDDVLLSKNFSFTPSAVKTINGEDVIGYLTKFAALNSLGHVDPHSDWNDLMGNPALDIQANIASFQDAAFYPGDNLTFVLENGTEVDTVWIAIYQESPGATGPLRTGGDFYNYFVLGYLPDSYDPDTYNPPASNSTPTNNAEEPLQTSWFDDSYYAYPEHPDVHQYDLSIGGGGIVSGYFLNDTSTGVLSIPSFYQFNDGIENFTATVRQFITNATSANIKRVVIDLQQNQGGALILAFITFKQFFPDLAPFAGSRRRVVPLANTLGKATTNYWKSLNDNDDEEWSMKKELAADEWNAATRLNAATGNNFSTWEEYAGPVTANGDTFSLTERYDLANPTFDSAAFGNWLPLQYLPGAESESPERPWEPNAITILTDGLCSSSCALFLEAMTRVGVRTVAVGGRPSTGPMQVSAQRGATYYDANNLDNDIILAGTRDPSANSSLPRNRDDFGIWFNYIGFNLRDQIRKDENVPLQFKYEAADCRIFYTFDNIYNMTRLWRDAAAAIWDDPSRCIEGSTGFSTINDTSPKTAPKIDSSVQPILTTSPVELFEFVDDPDGGLQDGPTRSGGNVRAPKVIQNCRPDGGCNNGGQCRPVPTMCSDLTMQYINLCLPTCSRTCLGVCNPIPLESKQPQSARRVVQYSGPSGQGICYPDPTTPTNFC